jgi:type IV pilus assembly protein PilC
MSSYWENRQLGDNGGPTAPATLVQVAPEPAVAPAAAPGVVKKKTFWNLELTPRKIPRRDLMHFSRQLAVFVKGGIPILDALNDIAGEMANKHLRAVVGEIESDLRGGSTFHVAVAKHGDAFPSFYAGMLETSEMTGNLDVVLDKLADYIEREVESRRRIVSALVYPIIVFCLAIVVVIVLMTFVLPKFQTFFQQLDAKLPLVTRMLISTSHGISHAWYVIAAVAALLVVFVLWCMTTPRGHQVRDVVLLKLPLVGDIVRHAVLERFCRVLGAMVSAGVPLPQAMAVTSDAVSNAVFRRGLLTARAAMVRGEGLAGPLAATGLFPAAARQMLRVGEDTGALDSQLETAANYYDRELNYKIGKFTSIFEPAVIIIVGLVVGFVALALISAMYGIYRQVHIS